MFNELFVYNLRSSLSDPQDEDLTADVKLLTRRLLHSSTEVVQTFHFHRQLLIHDQEGLPQPSTWSRPYTSS